MKNKRKKILSILQIVISVGLLTFLLWNVGPQDVFATLRTIDWRWYLPAFILFLINIILRAYRWFLLIRTLDKRPAFSFLIYLYFVGYFANNFIPSGFGGDVVKAASLRQVTGRGATAVSSVVMDRVTGLLGSTIIALIALVWNGITHTTQFDLPTALWAAIFAFTIGIPISLIILRLYNPFLWLADKIPGVVRVPKYGKLIELSSTVSLYPWSVLMRSLLVSLPFTLTLIIIQYSIARALGVILPIAVFSLFVPIISILNLLPISFNGLGVRETLYPILFVPMGVETATAVSMALAFSFLRISAGLIGGLMLASRNIITMLQTPQVKNL